MSRHQPAKRSMSRFLFTSAGCASAALQKRLLLIGLCLFTPLVCQAKWPENETSYFYYYFDEKIPLTISTEKIAIYFEEDLPESEKQAILDNDSDLDRLVEFIQVQGISICTLRPNLSTKEVINALNRNLLEVGVRLNAPFLFTEESGEHSFTLADDFGVEFESQVTREQVEVLIKDYPIEIASITPSRRRNGYLFRLLDPKSNNVLELANLFQLLPLVEYSAPNFRLNAYLFGPLPTPTPVKASSGLFILDMLGGVTYLPSHE